jgi:hypothetical protein
MLRIAVVVLAVATVLAAAPRAPAAEPHCKSSGKTLMASAQVRLFRFSGFTYACWVRRHSVRNLGVGSDAAPLGSALLAVATRWAAWSSSFCGFDERCDFNVQVMDVRTGRRVRSRLPDGAGTTSLVVDARGIPAWIEQDADTVRVVARARDGTRRVLDDDPAVHPRSLALARSYVYWSTRAGEPRTARLP